MRSSVYLLLYCLLLQPAQNLELHLLNLAVWQCHDTVLCCRYLSSAAGSILSTPRQRRHFSPSPTWHHWLGRMSALLLWHWSYYHWECLPYNTLHSYRLVPCQESMLHLVQNPVFKSLAVFKYQIWPISRDKFSRPHKCGHGSIFINCRSPSCTLKLFVLYPLTKHLSDLTAMLSLSKLPWRRCEREGCSPSAGLTKLHLLNLTTTLIMRNSDILYRDSNNAFLYERQKSN